MQSFFYVVCLLAWGTFLKATINASGFIYCAQDAIREVDNIFQSYLPSANEIANSNLKNHLLLHGTCSTCADSDTDTSADGCRDLPESSAREDSWRIGLERIHLARYFGVYFCSRS